MVLLILENVACAFAKLKRDGQCDRISATGTGPGASGGCGFAQYFTKRQVLFYHYGLVVRQRHQIRIYQQFRCVHLGALLVLWLPTWSL
jgi:hypothetical protein